MDRGASRGRDRAVRRSLGANARRSAAIFPMVSFDRFFSREVRVAAMMNMYQMV
jgi:hypothetical protein